MYFSTPSLPDKGLPALRLYSLYSLYSSFSQVLTVVGQSVPACLLVLRSPAVPPSASPFASLVQVHHLYFFRIPHQGLFVNHES